MMYESTSHFHLNRQLIAINTEKHPACTVKAFFENTNLAKLQKELFEYLRS